MGRMAGRLCPIAVEGKQATNVLILPPRRGCPFSDRLAVLARRPLCLFPLFFLFFIDIFFVQLSVRPSGPLFECWRTDDGQHGAISNHRPTSATLLCVDLLSKRICRLSVFVPSEIAIAPFGRCRLCSRRFFNSSLIQYAAIKLVFLSFHSFSLSLSLIHHLHLCVPQHSPETRHRNFKFD